MQVCIRLLAKDEINHVVPSALVSRQGVIQPNLSLAPKTLDPSKLHVVMLEGSASTLKGTLLGRLRQMEYSVVSTKLVELCKNHRDVDPSGSCGLNKTLSFQKNT